MEKNLNYEDNIFILNTAIRMISDINLLEADHTLFFDKTLEDLEFTNRTAASLVENLLQNTQLVDWDDYIYKLCETEKKFSLLLNAILNGNGCISAKKFPAIAGKIEALTGDCSKRISLLQSRISADTPQTGNKHMVGEDELNVLFARPPGK